MYLLYFLNLKTPGDKSRIYVLHIIIRLLSDIEQINKNMAEICVLCRFPTNCTF